MSETVSQGKKKRIIIVEDNILVAKFFQMALERAGGFSCMVSEDVPEILREVTAGEVDLVLLDVSLSNAEWDGHRVNGVELCRILKEKSPAASLCFLPPPTR
jgi:two-component system, cell cycle response regulator DivK